MIDTCAWDALGEQGKTDYFADMSARNPARRIGTIDDIAGAVLFAMTSTFLTGQTLHIDGGEPLTWHPAPGWPSRRAHPKGDKTMGLAWQQGPLAPGAIGRFLVPDRCPNGCCSPSRCAAACA